MSEEAGEYNHTEDSPEVDEEVELTEEELEKKLLKSSKTTANGTIDPVALKIYVLREQIRDLESVNLPREIKREQIKRLEEKVEATEALSKDKETVEEKKEPQEASPKTIETLEKHTTFKSRLLERLLQDEACRRQIAACVAKELS